MRIVKKKGVGDSLCKIFHPKCLKTTNFDRFCYGVSLRYVFKISCQIPKYSDYAINIAINNKQFWFNVANLVMESINTVCENTRLL